MKLSKQGTKLFKVMQKLSKIQRQFFGKNQKFKKTQKMQVQKFPVNHGYISDNVTLNNFIISKVIYHYSTLIEVI